jgi:hypothetical protein
MIRGFIVLGAVFAVAVAALAGFALGAREPSTIHLTGRANVGNGVASIRSEGTYYGVSESVPWIDAIGSFHDDGWPECFGEPGSTTRVGFGVTPVTVPDAPVFTPVVYVDCRISEP